MNTIERRLAAVEKSFNSLSAEQRANELAELGDDPVEEILAELCRATTIRSHDEWVGLFEAEEAV